MIGFFFSITPRNCCCCCCGGATATTGVDSLPLLLFGVEFKVDDDDDDVGVGVDVDVVGGATPPPLFLAVDG